MTDRSLIIDSLTLPNGGVIGMCACPGRNHGTANAADEAWDRDLARDLRTIETWRPALVVTLVESHEFAALGVPGLPRAMRGAAFEWQHFPVPDLHAPDSRDAAGWAALCRRLSAELAAGARILLHCAGGKGRTGTVAARLLIGLGSAPAEAITQIRRARRGAIESRAQCDYLLGQRPHRWPPASAQG